MMVSVVEALILGIVQGITEWLPLSSSAHLIFFQELFHYNASLFYDVLLHMGTLLAVILFYRTELVALFRNLFHGTLEPVQRRLLWHLFIATALTGIIGILFHDELAAMFTSISLTAITLIINGCLLFICERWQRSYSLSAFRATAIGIAQGISIIPGISRSGATIGTALLLGVEKKEATHFSFLLSIPAIIGAFILEFDSSLFVGIQFLPAVIGFLTSFIVGYIVLGFLLRMVMQRKFHWFAYYCWIVGILVLWSIW